MKTKGEKVAELIDALDNGSIIYKDHDFGEREFLFKAGDSYEAKGWSSALGTAQDRILEITKNPEDWKIFPNFNMNSDEYPYPYPWSTKWKVGEIKPNGLNLTIVFIENEKGEGYTGYFKELHNISVTRDTKEEVIEVLTDYLRDVFLNALDEYNKS